MKCKYRVKKCIQRWSGDLYFITQRKAGFFWVNIVETDRDFSGVKTFKEEVNAVAALKKWIESERIRMELMNKSKMEIKKSPYICVE